MQLQNILVPKKKENVELEGGREGGENRKGRLESVGNDMDTTHKANGTPHRNL